LVGKRRGGIGLRRGRLSGELSGQGELELGN
jgi:hypothetical protein